MRSAAPDACRLATNPAALLSLTALLFFLLAFVTGSLTSTILAATDSLPDGPGFSDYLFGWSSSPFVHGGVIGGSLEEGLRVFGDLGERAAGVRADREQSYLEWEDYDDESYLDRFANWMEGRSVRAARRQREKLLGKAEARNLPWAAFVVVRTAIGFATLGLLSFMQLLASFALLGPVHHLRLFNRGRGENRRAGQTGIDVGAIIVIAFVLIGAWRAFRTLYRLVRRGARYALSKLELRVLEVR